MRVFILAITLLGFSTINALGEADWTAFFPNAAHAQETRTNWYELEAEKRDRIASHLMKTLHLMQDGRIEAVGRYQLYLKSELGKKGDRIFHFIQKDRIEGSRLYWSCLVNVDSMKVQILYLASDSTSTGNIVEIRDYNSKGTTVGVGQ